VYLINTILSRIVSFNRAVNQALVLLNLMNAHFGFHCIVCDERVKHNIQISCRWCQAKHCLWKEILSQQSNRHFKILQGIYFTYDAGIIRCRTKRFNHFETAS